MPKSQHLHHYLFGIVRQQSFSWETAKMFVAMGKTNICNFFKLRVKSHYHLLREVKTRKNTKQNQPARVFKNIVLKLSAILARFQCIKSRSQILNW